MLQLTPDNTAHSSAGTLCLMGAKSLLKQIREKKSGPALTCRTMQQAAKKSILTESGGEAECLILFLFGSLLFPLVYLMQEMEVLLILQELSNFLFFSL